MRTVDMISLSKILLEEYSINDKGELVPKTVEERKKAISENEEKQKTFTAQNLMNAKANVLTTVSKAISSPEDKQNMKLLVSVVVIVGLVELAKNAPVAGQVVAVIGGAIAIGVIASKVRANKLYGSSTIPKDEYITKLDNFINVLREFQKEINDNKFKFKPKQQLINNTPKNTSTTDQQETNTDGKLYVSSFCVTSVKSNCVRMDDTGQKTQFDPKKTQFDPKIKQFVKGMLKYMENIFDTLLTIDDTKIKLDTLDGLIDAEKKTEAKLDEQYSRNQELADQNQPE